MSLGETISPRKCPSNLHPIGLGANGKPQETASLDFEPGEGLMAPEEKGGR